MSNRCLVSCTFMFPWTNTQSAIKDGNQCLKHDTAKIVKYSYYCRLCSRRSSVVIQVTVLSCTKMWPKTTILFKLTAKVYNPLSRQLVSATPYKQTKYIPFPVFHAGKEWSAINHSKYQIYLLKSFLIKAEYGNRTWLMVYSGDVICSVNDSNYFSIYTRKVLEHITCNFNINSSFKRSTRKPYLIRVSFIHNINVV